MNSNDEMTKAEVHIEPPVTLKFAPAWKRILSYLIDLLILNCIISFMITFALSGELAAIMKNVPQAGDPLAYYKTLEKGFMEIFLRHQSVIIPVILVIQISYFTLFWMAGGQTAGARIMRIVVMSMDRKRINIVQGILRSLILGVCLIYILPYLVLIFPINMVYRQRIHDFISGSVVVEMPEEKKNKREKSPDEESIRE